jgi:hypothetical protein
MSFNTAFIITVKKLKNKIVYYKEAVECRHVIFWPVVRDVSTAILKTGAKSEGHIVNDDEKIWI